MAQSPEYPDLPWMAPRSWTDADRASVQLLVIHTTEGAARPGAARDGAAYDQRRTDGTSAHFYIDSEQIVQCVRTADQAHTARGQGNRRGVHYELCGRTTLDWSGGYAQAMLRLAARQVARDAKRWGIPVRKLTAAQVAAGQRGLCGHADITAAFPRDGGTHTDPGAAFPWNQFLALVQAQMHPPAKTEQEDDVTEEQIKTAVVEAIYGLFAQASAAADDVPGGDTATGRNFRNFLNTISDFSNVELRQRLDQQAAALQALPGAIVAELPEDAGGEGFSEAQRAELVAAAQRALATLKLTAEPS